MTSYVTVIRHEPTYDIQRHSRGEWAIWVSDRGTERIWLYADPSDYPIGQTFQV